MQRFGKEFRSIYKGKGFRKNCKFSKKWQIFIRDEYDYIVPYFIMGINQYISNWLEKFKCKLADIDPHELLEDLQNQEFSKKRYKFAKAMGDRLFSEKWGEIFRNYFKLRGC